MLDWLVFADDFETAEWCLFNPDGAVIFFSNFPLQMQGVLTFHSNKARPDFKYIYKNFVLIFGTVVWNGLKWHEKCQSSLSIILIWYTVKPIPSIQLNRTHFILYHVNIKLLPNSSPDSINTRFITFILLTFLSPFLCSTNICEKKLSAQQQL